MPDMRYFDVQDWEKIKKDVQHGVEKGMVALKNGAIVAKQKAGDLTDEGKRQYKIYALKTKLHKGFADLGARVYSLMGKRAKNPALDAKVRAIVSQLKEIEEKVANLEKEPGSAPRKTARKAARKKAFTR
jgi:hypothetical protein